MPTSLGTNIPARERPPTDEMSTVPVRLRDMINMVIGVAITLAPWFNGDDAATHGAIRVRIIAATICAVSLWILTHQRHISAELLNLAFGITLVTSPFWRGPVDALRIDFAIAGAIVGVLSASCAVQLVRERIRPPQAMLYAPFAPSTIHYN
jgi:hypothetical protein